MSEDRCCGACEYFARVGVTYVCKRRAMIVPIREEPWEEKCPYFKADLAFTEIKDVFDFYYDNMCGGCEYSKMDHDGHEYPSDECCCGRLEESNYFEDDIKKLTLQQAIRKWTVGNDRRWWPGYELPREARY